MKTTSGWHPATVVKVREEPRAYDNMPVGAKYRRNRTHLRWDRPVADMEDYQFSEDMNNHGPVHSNPESQETAAAETALGHPLHTAASRAAKLSVDTVLWHVTAHGSQPGCRTV
ncbi:hypothetical protein AAFF_G00091150 [Aldrovandia affinis]|uniref:Uncharacterized protein n=1 Tax=Aldrovandia affinis TaxID=143900 RepID=A0AAD7RVY2_9TELE|nr:hypothetical protein AAFF_G00091150 [Aldrovandia affinis]